MKRSIPFLMLLVLTLTLLEAAAPNVPARTWWKSSNRIADVYGSIPSPGGTSQTAVTVWGGGAYNDSAEWLIVWGGGHGDYSGNEIYIFDLDSTTPAWRRERDHSGTINTGGAAEATCLYSGDDQSPRSRHTYNHLQWVGISNRFMSTTCKDPATSASESPNIAQWYDFTARTWTTLANNAVGAASISSHSVSAYDRQTGYVWFHGVSGSGYPSRYRPWNNTWATHGDIFSNGGQIANCSTCDIDTTFSPNRMYCTGGCSGTGRTVYLILDTTDTDLDTTQPTVTGPTKCQDAIRPGFVYSTRDSVFVAWCGNGTGNDSVYTFNPRTNAWAGIGPAGGNTVTPTNALANGTKGRWRYSPRYGLFILQNATTDSTYVYRLSDTASAPVASNPFGIFNILQGF